MTESLYCPPEIQNIVNWLYSKTKLEALKKKKVVQMQEKNRYSLQRSKEQESEGNKQGVRRTMDNFVLF